MGCVVCDAGQERPFLSTVDGMVSYPQLQDITGTEVYVNAGVWEA